MRVLERAVDEAVSYEGAKVLLEMKDVERLFETAQIVARQNDGDTVHLYKNAFPPVSVTGTKCSLSCHHCGRHYLKHMAPATTNEELVEYCVRLKKRGVPGIVLSGGSKPDGVVPLCDFADGIRRVREQTGMAILAHTGPVNERHVQILDRAGLSGALLDVIGSADTAENVTGVKISPEKYANSINAISESGIELSPHIIVGLDYGKINGELKALELLRPAKVGNICIVVLVPTENTPMASVPPPSPDTVGRLIAIAKLMYPRVPISLGCVRPGKMYRRAIDAAAVRAGASKVAVPSTEAKRTAEEIGLKIKEYEQMCCGWDSP